MCPVVCTDYLMWDSAALNLSKRLFFFRQVEPWYLCCRYCPHLEGWYCYRGRHLQGYCFGLVDWIRKLLLPVGVCTIARLISWTWQLQAFFLVSDDIMDASITRRGQPCWYKSEGVGMVAINDAFILESCIYIFLKKYFKKTDYYIELVELFHEVTFQTELGQLCDLITAPEDDVDLSKFSIKK